jgi:hypothetical protein
MSNYSNPFPPPPPPPNAPQYAQQYAPQAAQAPSMWGVSQQFGEPRYKLFDVGNITLASFLGGPLAGSILLGLNYQRLGDQGKAWSSYLCGAAVMAAAAGLGFVIPHGVQYPIAIGLIVAMRQVAERLQGPAISKHVDAGGKLATKWIGFGVGMAFLTLVMGLVLLPLLPSLTKTKVTIGSSDQIYYAGTATKDEAQALGDSLKTQGLLQDQGANVFLKKESDGTTISIILKEGMWNKPGMLETFEDIFRRAAPTVGGMPIHVKLLNGEKEVQKEGTIGRVAIGEGDAVVYKGTATEADARAFGQSLKDQDYLQGKNFYVSINKEAGVTTMSFAVNQGAWNRPTSVAAFESIARTAAPSVGGLPVQLRLVDTDLVTQREETVN